MEAMALERWSLPRIWKNWAVMARVMACRCRESQAGSGAIQTKLTARLRGADGGKGGEAWRCCKQPLSWPVTGELVVWNGTVDGGLEGLMYLVVERSLSIHAQRQAFRAFLTPSHVGSQGDKVATNLRLKASRQSSKLHYNRK